MAPTLTEDQSSGAATHSPAGASDLLAPAPGRRVDDAFGLLVLAAGLMVLVILAGIAFATTRKAWPAFSHQGISFVTTNDWVPSEDRYGALAFIYGTLVSSFIALVIAVPISVGIALFTQEVVGRRFRRPVVYLIDLLAAIPSVVYGLWGVLVFAPAVQPVYETINGWVGGWPVLGALFGGQSSGRSFMTAGIILAIMITPIVTSLSREVVATVPSSQREAAYGMGATRWETIRSSVLPWCRGGITGAVMLGLGRAVGETIAVLLVIGSSAQITTHLFSPGDSTAAVIANQWGEASTLGSSALIGLGVVLFVVTVGLNFVARSFVRRFDRRLQGA